MLASGTTTPALSTTVTSTNDSALVSARITRCSGCRTTVSAAPAGFDTLFDASKSTVKFGSITSYLWDFGDGSPPVATTSPSLSHTYNEPGSFTASVTETDSAGTSTKSVFTGQTMSRHGDPSAVGLDDRYLGAVDFLLQMFLVFGMVILLAALIFGVAQRMQPVSQPA